MNKPRVAIIGSGFGGLAVALHLQASGFETVIFEKRNLPGGCAYVYRDRGFTFDAGPTVITEPDCLRELFTLAGRRLEDYVRLIPTRPFYRLFWEDGLRFDYSNDMEWTLKQIAEISPTDVAGYRRFFEFSREVYKQGYEKLAHVPFLDWKDMLRAAPELARLKAYRSVYTAVAKHIRDERLRQAFSFHSLLVGGNPFSASSIYTLIHYLEQKGGVYSAAGGTGALVAALVALFKELGGEIRLGAAAEKIVTRGGRVKAVATREGTEDFDLVVSNANVMHTYDSLLRGDAGADAISRRLKRMRFSMSLFVLYFGTRRKYSGLAQHNVIFGPRYKELLADVFDRGRLADDFSLYLHAPSYTDPSLAPPGCHAFYVLSPVPHLGKLAIDWKSAGPVYADKILSYLERRYMPGLKSDLVTQQTLTPEDFRQEMNFYLGSAFSLEPRLSQSAYFRVHNRDRNIQGLYFVGAGTHPGAGVPGVVNSAKAAAGLILRDFKSAATAGTAAPGSYADA